MVVQSGAIFTELFACSVFLSISRVVSSKLFICCLRSLADRLVFDQSLDELQQESELDWEAQARYTLRTVQISSFRMRNALNFEVRFWAPRPQAVLELKSEVALSIATALSKAGIKVPVPQRTLNITGPNQNARASVAPSTNDGVEIETEA